MKTWTIDDAQSHFTEVLESSTQEPQIIAANGEPIAALVDIDLFNDFISFQHRPSIAELLTELRDLQTQTPVELTPSDRKDRPNPLLEQA